VHFLRKQGHVESSNQIVPFMEAVFQFWKTREKSHLERHVPPAIYEQVDSRGPYVDGLHRVMQRLVKKGVRIPDDLLTLAAGEIRPRLGYVPGVAEVDIERFELAVELYKLLYQKYRFHLVELEAYLTQLRPEALPELARLEKALAEPAPARRLALLIDYLETLKGIIVSDVAHEVREDIYQKRHITIDILMQALPSRASASVRVLADLCTLGIALVIGYYGWKLTAAATQITATLQIPHSVVYIVVPVSAVLVFVHTLGDFVRNCRAAVGRAE